MILRTLVRLWRWLRTKPRDTMSEDWMREHSRGAYDDDPKAKSRRDE